MTRTSQMAIGLCTCLALLAGPTAHATPTTKAKASATSTHTFRYLMKFRGSKAGTIEQTLTHKPNGEIVSQGKSDSLFRVFFIKVKTTARFRATYRKGKLQSFRLDRVQRGKKLSVRATRTAKGFDVVHVKEGTKKVAFFANKDFQGTSRDLRIPMGAPGTTRKRKILNFVQCKVTPQTLRYVRHVTKTTLGQKLKLMKVKAVGKKGSLTMYMTQRSFMISSFAKIRMLGKVEILLTSLKGRTLQGF